MQNEWKRALDSYRYSVNPTKRADGDQFPDFFELRMAEGNRTETIEFEDRFRDQALNHIEAWYEVIYWKLFSQGGIGRAKAQDIVSQLSSLGVRPQQLWEACQEYVSDPSRERFDSFRRLFGFKTSSIATIATFPAFVAPDRFPMVDTRVAKWINAEAKNHNSIDPQGPQLKEPRLKTGVLQMRHFDFYMAWVMWCRHTAAKLSNITGEGWRARDVEMAVFTAQGAGKKQGLFRLEALPD